MNTVTHEHEMVEVQCRLKLHAKSVNVSKLFIVLSDLYTEGSVVASAANVTGCGIVGNLAALGFSC